VGKLGQQATVEVDKDSSAMRNLIMARRKAKGFDFLSNTKLVVSLLFVVAVVVFVTITPKSSLNVFAGPDRTGPVVSLD